MLNILHEAYNDTVHDIDCILEWCYPLPGSGRFREANFTNTFVSHALRRLNGGIFPIRSCKEDAFGYFEAPVKLTSDSDRQDGRVDAIIAAWKSSSFIAIESKGSYKAQGGEIENQVQRLCDSQTQHTLLRNFDCPSSDPLNFWLVVMSGYWGEISCPEEGPDFWIQQFNHIPSKHQSLSRYKKINKRTDMETFGVLFYCALISKEAWLE